MGAERVGRAQRRKPALDGKTLGTIQPGVYANLLRCFRPQQGDADANLIADGGPAGATLLALSGQGQKLWSRALPGNSQSVDSLAVAPTAPWAAVGLRGGAVCVVNLDDGRLIARAVKQGATPQVGWLHAQAKSPPLLIVATGSALTAMTIMPQGK